MKGLQNGRDDSQKGAMIVFLALVLPVLIFFGGMAIDLGGAYFYKAKLQNAADGAALAGVAAAAGSNGRSWLVDIEDMPIPMDTADKDDTLRANSAAAYVLDNDVSGAPAPGHQLFVLNDVQTDKPQRYYYRVEISDYVPLRFAGLFLLDSFLPKGFPVKVQAVAMAKTGSGDLLKQMEVLADRNTFSDFYDLKQYYKKLGYNDSQAHEMAKSVSFTNKSILYSADGTRSEIFNMDGNAEINNQFKKLLVNFKPDIRSAKKENAFTYNWDVSDLWGLSAEEARNTFYNPDDMSKADILFTNWLLYTEAEHEIVGNGPHEGATITWDAFYRQYVNSQHLFDSDTALAVLTSRIESVINVTAPYKKRENLASLPNEEVYIGDDGRRNMQDPLFVRIESEEFNESRGSYVTNSVRKISINVLVDNTDDEYRPMLFFYDGPIDVEGKRGQGRKSQTVTLNLEADFKGMLYAPNSPVCIKGNNHSFQGIIIAESLVDESGNPIYMPQEVNQMNASEFQSFSSQLGLSDAKYDDFGVVELVTYKNPKKDVVFLTDRAKVTW